MNMGSAEGGRSARNSGSCRTDTGDAVEGMDIPAPVLSSDVASVALDDVSGQVIFDFPPIPDDLDILLDSEGDENIVAFAPPAFA